MFGKTTFTVINQGNSLTTGLLLCTVIWALSQESPLSESCTERWSQWTYSNSRTLCLVWDYSECTELLLCRRGNVIVQSYWSKDQTFYQYVFWANDETLVKVTVKDLWMKTESRPVCFGLFTLSNIFLKCNTLHFVMDRIMISYIYSHLCPWSGLSYCISSTSLL